MGVKLKPVGWIASSRKDLRGFPVEVQGDVGFALYQAQRGLVSATTKPLRGFGGASVVEVVVSHDGDAYRAVYTVRFAEVIYVLHCFQKKSKSGAKTPPQDIDLIKARLRLAEVEYELWKKRK